MKNNIDLSYFNEGDVVVVGLSGGADSVALTHMLHFQKSKSITVIACHLNHNLRGEESLRDRDFVKNICKKWGIDLIVEEVDLNEISKKTSKGLEECGRDCRYDLFERVSKKFNARYIATAHTMSDNLETIIFNMIRGSGLNGLCGIPNIRQNIVRPILNLTRHDIEEYCRTNNLEYVTDSSNLTTDYTRNKIRHIVIPKLKEINLNAEENVNRLVNSLKEDLNYLEKISFDEYQKIKLDDKSIDLSHFNNLEMSIKKRIIIIFLTNNNLEVTNKYIENILSIISKGYGKFNICKDKYIVCKNFVLYLEIIQPKLLKQVNEPLCDKIFTSNTGNNYKIQTLEIDISKNFNKIYKNVFDIWIDCGKIIGSVVIRNRFPKDKIKLSEKQSTKTLKNIFQEKKIDSKKRKELFVISDEKGVIAVEGIGVASRVVCDNNTNKAIRITKID